MSVKPVPEGFSTVTPVLAIDGAARAIDFYRNAFGAVEIERAMDPSGSKIWHAFLKIGDSPVFVNDVFPEMGSTQSHSSIWLYVPDVDAWFKRAVDAGGTAAMAPMDTFWGDRMGVVVDPFGQKWTISTHVKDMTPEEIKEAEKAFIERSKAKKEG